MAGSEYYDHTTFPSQGAAGSSAAMRAELETIEAGFGKLPDLSGNGNKVVSVNPGGTALVASDTPALGTPSSGDATNMTNTVAPQTHAAASKATPVDADALPITDSAASNGLKKLTWANLKAGLFTAWGALINTATGKTTPADADAFAIMDSAASNATKKLTIANLKVAVTGLGKNKLINGNFGINQRGYGSGAATSAGQYTLDRWKVTGTGGITFSTTNNVTTVTIPSGQTLQQVIEGLNLQSGTHVLSWAGTAQGRIDGGAYGASGAVTATAVGGTNMTVEFGPGTVSLAQLEEGLLASRFEQRQFGVELAMAQRHLELISTSSASLGLTAYCANTQIARTGGVFKVTKRAAPTGSGNADLININGSGFNSAGTSLSFNTTATGFHMDVTATGAPLTAGNAVSIGIPDSALVLFTAEL